MTPEQEKVKELIERYKYALPLYTNKSAIIQCAIIDVNNTIEALIGSLSSNKEVAEWQLKEREFWTNVKKELEK